MHGKIMTIYQVDVDEKILLNQISPHTVLWRCWLDVTSVAWNSFVIINFINIHIHGLLQEDWLQTSRLRTHNIYCTAEVRVNFSV